MGKGASRSFGLLLLVALPACLPVQSVEETKTKVSLSLSSPSTSSGSQTELTFSLSGLPEHLDAIVALYWDSDCQEERTSARTFGSSSASLKVGLRSAGTYQFSAKAYDGTSWGGCSEAVTYRLTSLSAPASMSMVSTNPGYDATPEVQVGGVASGDTASVYLDASCSAHAGSAVATGSSVEVTLSTLPAAGAYTLYSRRYRSGALPSACSTASVSYTLQSPLTPSALNLLNPAASPGTDRTPTVTVGGVESGLLVRLYDDSSCSNEVGSAVAAATSVNVTTSALTPGVSYTLYADSANDLERSACSSPVSVAYQLNYLPAPTSLALNTPAASPHYYQRPKIDVGGVSAGQTVSVYSDSTCSTEVGSAEATGASVTVELDELTSLQTYNFYAKVTDSDGGVSQCSTAPATVSYTLNSRVSFASGSSVEVGVFPRKLSSGDLNGDGKLDIAVANSHGPGVHVLYGLGNGTFTKSGISGTSAASSVLIADLGGDGFQDLIVAPAGEPEVQTYLTRQRDVSFYASYAYYQFPNWYEGSISTSLYPAVASWNGALDLTGGTSQARVEHQAEDNADFDRLGQIWFDYIPNYSGIPMAEQDIFSLNNWRTTLHNNIEIKHKTDGTLSADVYGSDGNLIFNLSFAFSPTAGQTYPVRFSLNLDGTSRLFINNTAMSASTTATGTRIASGGTEDITRIYFGVDYTLNGIPDFKIKDFKVLRDLDGDDAIFTTRYMKDPVSYASANPVQTVDRVLDLVYLSAASWWAPGLRVANGVSLGRLSGFGNGALNLLTNLSAPGGAAQAVASGDFNGDGTEEFAVTNSASKEVRVFVWDTGSSAYVTADLSVNDNPTDVAAGDLNGDGFPDLVVSTVNDSGVSVYLNDGFGNFAAGVDYTLASGEPWAIQVADIDGDLSQDVVVADTVTGRVSVFFGNGTGTLGLNQDYVAGPALYAYGDFVIGDFNGDGKQDLAVTTGHTSGSNDTISILLRQ